MHQGGPTSKAAHRRYNASVRGYVRNARMGIKRRRKAVKHA